MSRSARKMNQAAAGYALQQEPPAGPLTAQQLTALKSKRILFGHQSVGANMVDGIPALYSSYSVSPPTMIDASQINSTSGGFFADFYVGVNGDPVGKTADFNTTVRQYSSKLDIALMKFCFIDIVQGVNVSQVFNAYKSVMDQLVSDFPAIKFVYATAALDEYSVDNAVTREQLNTLIRNQYASTGRLFDLAAIESTRPNGTRVSGTSGGNTYYQLYDAYSSDGGHLNATGEQVVDTAFFTLLAQL
ncbi:hypothetical protein EYC58_05760 [Candidatus Saccharibacteria bacterium]|nr:MAG: hypothetical protein EYC58_05760 [Candidatus Saccharibacteria bacterium]